MPEAPRTRRLFVALTLAEDVAARVEPRMAPLLRSPDLRVYPARDLHLTLAFLGSFPEERRPALEESLADELRGLRAPELWLTGTGAFPGRREPRILWLGIEEEAGAVGRLDALRNRVWQAALCHGWRPPRAERGRPFRPHLTVARARARGRGARVDGGFFELRLGERWQPVEVELVESRPDCPGARYAALAAVPLLESPS